ncbi:FtsX-like permease family protein [Streptomyces yaizuensis]|uniref:FtsX-like permease family protein n=1 Tax=Streptomyces yaizuensis TaxID=2989713 RepID=A0ABQ5NVL5_9ACTN|nr:FtsX-like permease family protein [Streptomyces sp. YSPA8]GLF94413.1 FtsX-like permease family protein [Streptomyces sp. YSPA8]
MTLSVRRRPAAPPVRTRPGPLQRWAHDLALGLRFGVAGGREGWIRNALTAVGVGLGVAFLLLAASVPQIMDSRNERLTARTPSTVDQREDPTPSGTSVLVLHVSTEYRSEPVIGQLLRPEGDRPALPPGVSRIPGPGEMLVSPALGRLLRSPEGAALAQRLDDRVVGTVGGSGLVDPGELLFYAGSDTLTAPGMAFRTDGFGPTEFGFTSGPIDPVLTALGTLITVVLLVPVAVFIGIALRFGGDRRDRRLAALRLVGADMGTVRRIAAGEALFAALLGVVTGCAVFATGRLAAGSVRIWGLSAFPSDVVPVPWLAALILAAVPVVSVPLTLFTLRSVVVDPLGVVRRSAPRGRRLWWRLLTPAAGVAILSFSDRIPDWSGPEQPFPLALGATLVLLGVTALFPWLVGAVVGRLRGGPLSFQLAVRGLQLRSGTATRAVSGIMVAVAGVIALQMVFAGMHEDQRRASGRSPAWRVVEVTDARPDAGFAARMAREFRATAGVAGVVPMVTSTARYPAPGPVEEQPFSPVVIADCPELRKLARIRTCADGDTFVANMPSENVDSYVNQAARRGEELIVDRVDAGGWRGEPAVPGFRWRLPADAEAVTSRQDVAGWHHEGIYATPGALDPGRLRNGGTTVLVRVDDDVPGTHDRVRDTAARISPALAVWSSRSMDRDQKFRSMHNVLLAGATATMVLIAASMVITQIEQLRERRRLLSVLLAFGTRRSTLAWSQLWQTVLPVVLGTVVAAVGGLVLGTVMLRLIAMPLVDWWGFLPVAGTGAGVILLVALVGLPALWRMMRTDGLRTE